MTFVVVLSWLLSSNYRSHIVDNNKILLSNQILLLVCIFCIIHCNICTTWILFYCSNYRRYIYLIRSYQLPTVSCSDFVSVDPHPHYTFLPSVSSCVRVYEYFYPSQKVLWWVVHWYDLNFNLVTIEWLFFCIPFSTKLNF